MRKLIEIKRVHVIVCDNPNCDYKVATKNDDINISSFINRPCPKCGDNLLTLKDYEDSIRMIKTVNWFNKWFSWITLFTKEKKRKKVTIHVHNGVNIEDNS